MNTTIIKILIAFLLMSAGIQAQSISSPSGPFRDTNSEDFRAKNLSSKFYNELWTYHINLDNGVQLIYTFSINDFGSFKSRATGVKLSVSWTDGKTYVVNKEYSPETFINEPDSNYMRPHPERPYYAKGNFNNKHRLFFHNTKDGVQYDLDLTFFDIAQGKTIGDGVYKVGNHEIGISILMPQAKVKGMVAINGDTLKVKGVGYMDHIYQNNLSTKLIDRSYRIKTGDDENGMYIHFLILRNSGSDYPIGYGVGYKNGLEYMLTPSSINRITRDNKVHHLDKEVVIKPYQTDALNIKVDKHFNTYSLLDELGGIKKFFAKKALGGELIEMNGTVQINDEQPGYFYYLVTD
ncbi:MAG: hypothetical protein HUJ22_05435 [Gracilimonas sp.]|uniref:hypothetical protein n=1 Tax=Gracilimonas sp. TaxID=1974203 RepID=UPI00199FA47F|nr:hypothetical protein [Gracilimonas sp.]MBD3615997.1 hypothetical protein [Gracilimonas sp.]